MSSPNYVDYMVRQEQYKDLLREAKQERMVKNLEPRPGRYRVVAPWSGAQLMKWSSTLQSHISGKETGTWVTWKSN